MTKTLRVLVFRKILNMMPTVNLPAQISILSLFEITKETIDAVYYDQTHELGQTLAKMFTRCSIEDARYVFNNIPDPTAGELANILCAETRLYEKRFTTRQHTSNNVTLFHGEIPIVTVSWREFISPWGKFNQL